MTTMPEDARRNDAEIRLREYVQKVVADSPPLTEDQKACIRTLLGGVGR